MSELLNHSFTHFTLNPIKRDSVRGIVIRKSVSRTVHCVLTDDKKVCVVKNGKDSLEICRVINGMWQTGGAWGKIDKDNAVNAMLSYADAGFTSFDMADICNFPIRHVVNKLMMIVHVDFSILSYC